MMRLVAFLRGINVGGHTVKKEKLQEAFVSLGFQNVSTYKQSGNVIFDSTTEDMEKVRKKIETKLHDALGFEVAVFMRTMPQIKSILDMEMFKGQNKEGSSFLVTLLPYIVRFPMSLPLTIPKSTAQIIAAQDTEIFSVTRGGGEGALPNPFLEKTLKIKATTRNINILREIVEEYS